MVKTINKFCDYLEKGTSVIVNFLFIVLIVSCVLQVFTRYVLNNSLSWTEELARYCYIWSNILAAALCTKKRTHASISFLHDSISDRGKYIFDILIDFAILPCAYIMLKYGLQVATTFTTKMSPALKIPMFFYYIALPLSGALIIIFILADLLGHFVQPFINRERKD